MGGNDKAGLVNLWYWSMVPVGTVRPRLPGACCRDPTLSLAKVEPIKKKPAAPAPAPATIAEAMPNPLGRQGLRHVQRKMTVANEVQV